MTIELNHTIVPAHDKVSSAKFFARISGCRSMKTLSGYFAPVKVNRALTLDFEDVVDRFERPSLCRQGERSGLRRDFWPHSGGGHSL
jgi:hypothetical protein